MRVVRNLESLENILQKKRENKSKVGDRVRQILSDVRSRGDDALSEYTRKFDGVKINASEFKITEAQISAAFNELNSSLISALKVAIDNVSRFYKQQIPKTIRVKSDNGKVLFTKYVPLNRVGVYVPAGTAPLVSTVYMSVIPAIIAGVRDIVLVSPPSKEGRINPFVLAVASLLKIKEIYRVGGAQAVCALACGTKTIKKVDKIIGPGNEFVTEAKRQVFGEVDIDMLAGPSEVVILASQGANLDYIAADLEAQMEHSQGTGIVVTNSRRIIRELRNKRVDAVAIRVRNLDEACQVINQIAPEHLEIFIKKPAVVLKNITNAGAIFLGENSPVALGDYIAGPSHILPTGGSARFSSSLSVREFLKEIHIVSYTKKALQDEVAVLEKIAGLEGMQKHIESVKKRLG